MQHNAACTQSTRAEKVGCFLAARYTENQADAEEIYFVYIAMCLAITCGQFRLGKYLLRVHFGLFAITSQLTNLYLIIGNKCSALILQLTREFNSSIDSHYHTVNCSQYFIPLQSSDSYHLKGFVVWDQHSMHQVDTNSMKPGLGKLSLNTQHEKPKLLRYSLHIHVRPRDKMFIITL